MTSSRYADQIRREAADLDRWMAETRRARMLEAMGNCSYVTPRFDGAAAIHLADLSLASTDRPRTLCGRRWSGWWVGDETTTGFSASCSDCKRIFAARQQLPR